MELPENEQEGATEETILWSRNPAVYLGKSKLLQEAGNHLIMTKEELLKRLYYDLKNPTTYAVLEKLSCSKRQRNMTQIYQ